MLGAWSVTVGREITFEKRVRAQETIERVYYAHQVGASAPFEIAVPKAAIENKVRTEYQTVFIAEALRGEWERTSSVSRR